MSLKFATNPLLTWLSIPIAHAKMDFPYGISATDLVWSALSLILLSLTVSLILNSSSTVTGVTLGAWWVYRKWVLNHTCQEVFHLYRTPVSPVGWCYFSIQDCKALIYDKMSLLSYSIPPTFHVEFVGKSFSSFCSFLQNSYMWILGQIYSSWPQHPECENY